MLVTWFWVLVSDLSLSALDYYAELCYELITERAADTVERLTPRNWFMYLGQKMWTVWKSDERGKGFHTVFKSTSVSNCRGPVAPWRQGYWHCMCDSVCVIIYVWLWELHEGWFWKMPGKQGKSIFPYISCRIYVLPCYLLTEPTQTVNYCAATCRTGLEFYFFFWKRDEPGVRTWWKLLC